MIVTGAFSLPMTRSFMAAAMSSFVVEVAVGGVRRLGAFSDTVTDLLEGASSAAGVGEAACSTDGVADICLFVAAFPFDKKRVNVT